MQDASFGNLLYRYFFFGWLFKDASRGNMFERSAAWRYNREQARWLPTYMRRWFWAGVVLYAIGIVFEWLQAPGVSAFFYVPGAMAVPVNGVIAVAWLGLKLMPGPIRVTKS